MTQEHTATLSLYGIKVPAAEYDAIKQLATIIYGDMIPSNAQEGASRKFAVKGGHANTRATQN